MRVVVTVCVFCRAFEALYGLPAEVVLDPRRWREYDAAVAGSGKDVNRRPGARRAARRRREETS